MLGIHSQKCDPRKQRPLSRTPTVTAICPQRQTLVRTVEQPGQIEGVEQTLIHAKISGYVHKLHVDIGDRVRQGQLLAELNVPETVEEHRQKQAAVAQAKAEVERTVRILAASDAGLKKAEATIRLADASRQRTESGLARWKTQHGRDSRLVASNTINQQALDQTIDRLHSAEAAKLEAAASLEAAEAAREESAAHVEKARADIAVAKARLEFAEADERRLAALLDYARLTAPFDGIVTKRSADTGHLVQGSSGQPLFVVVRHDPVCIFIDVPEADASLIQAGTSARVIVQALQERAFEATVTRTSWALQTQARTMRAQIDLPNAEALLRPGMYATVRITAERSDVLTVPVSAIISRDDQSFVVCIEKGVARRTPVKLGQRDGRVAEILKKQVHPPAGDGRRTWESFRGTEEIVQHNPAALADGQTVHVQTSSSSAATQLVKHRSKSLDTP